MILVVFEDPNNHINSVVERIVNKFPNETIEHIYGSKVNPEKIQMLSQKPLLFKGWLIIFENGKVNIEQLNKLNVKDNLILIRVTSAKMLADVKNLLGDIEYQVRINNKLNEEIVQNWIANELKCSKSAAERLYKKCDGYLTKINDSVTVLKNCDNVTVQVVDTYIGKQSSAKSFDVVEYLLLGAACGCSYREIVKYLYDYRYAMSWLLKTIINSLELYIKVFTYEIDGSLSLVNYNEFLQTTEDKDIRNLSEYRLSKMLQMHEKVSLEYVYFILLNIQGIQDNTFGLYKLIKLLRII